MQAGQGGEIRVIGSPDSSIGSLVAVSLARSFSSNLNAIGLSVAAVVQTPGGAADPALLARAQAVPAGARLLTASAEDQATSQSTFFAIGMAVFFLFFAVEFGVRGLLEEREGGTLSRLLVAPVNPASVIGGKALASFALGLTSTVLLVIASTWLLSAEWGDPLGVAALVLGGVLAAVGVTALVATLAAHHGAGGRVRLDRRRRRRAARWDVLPDLAGGLPGHDPVPLPAGLADAGLHATRRRRLARGHRRAADRGVRDRVRDRSDRVGARLPDGGGMNGRKALAIAGVNLRRLLRDKTGAFFIFVFPFLIILALGAAFGSGFTPTLGVVVPAGSGALGHDLRDRFEAVEDLTVRSFANADDLRSAVEKGDVEGGLVVPAGYDERIRAGETVPLTFIARPGGTGTELQIVVNGVVDQQSVVVRAARFAVSEGAAAGFAEALTAAEALERNVPTVDVTARTAGGEQIGTFQAGAAQELILFVFLTSLSASAMLIETRRLGVTRRMLASPTSVRTILVGETLGRYAIALVQGLLIVVGTVLLFRVDWGNPLTTGLVVVLFSLAATGAAMVMGSVLKNAAQAGAMGVFLGLVLAAIGGCMVPLEIFPPTMFRIAHLFPHAWAIEALNGSIATGAGPAEVSTDLAVLAAYAIALLSVATVLLRRSITAHAARSEDHAPNRSVSVRPARSTSSGVEPGGMLKISPSRPASMNAWTASPTSSASPQMKVAASIESSMPRRALNSSRRACASSSVVATNNVPRRVFVISDGSRPTSAQ